MPARALRPIVQLSLEGPGSGHSSGGSEEAPGLRQLLSLCCARTMTGEPRDLVCGTGNERGSPAQAGRAPSW